MRIIEAKGRRASRRLRQARRRITTALHCAKKFIPKTDSSKRGPRSRPRCYLQLRESRWLKSQRLPHFALRSVFSLKWLAENGAGQAISAAALSIPQAADWHRVQNSYPRTIDG